MTALGFSLVIVAVGESVYLIEATGSGVGVKLALTDTYGRRFATGPGYGTTPPDGGTTPPDSSGKRRHKSPKSIYGLPLQHDVEELRRWVAEVVEVGNLRRAVDEQPNRELAAHDDRALGERQERPGFQRAVEHVETQVPLRAVVVDVEVDRKSAV